MDRRVPLSLSSFTHNTNKRDVTVLYIYLSWSDYYGASHNIFKIKSSVKNVFLFPWLLDMHCIIDMLLWWLKYKQLLVDYDSSLLSHICNMLHVILQKYFCFYLIVIIKWQDSREQSYWLSSVPSCADMSPCHNSLELAFLYYVYRKVHFLTYHCI